MSPREHPPLGGVMKIKPVVEEGSLVGKGGSGNEVGRVWVERLRGEPGLGQGAELRSRAIKAPLSHSPSWRSPSGARQPGAARHRPEAVRGAIRPAPSSPSPTPAPAPPPALAPPSP